ncbi:MAG: efflux RND transporter periplasmic adaptor subunit [Planctomycetota bacterium]|jgi:multidrug resistance efflux pump
MMGKNMYLFLILILSVLCGCTGGSGTGSDNKSGEEGDSGPVDRILLSDTDMSNLGIEYVKVERRRVAKTMRFPGHFECLPSAHREYRNPLSGRVKLLVQQYQDVRSGMPLYEIDSPEWRAIQQELVNAEAAIATAAADVEVAVTTREEAAKSADLLRKRISCNDMEHESSGSATRCITENIALWDKRIAELEKLHESGGGRASELAEARAQKASLELQRDEMKSQFASYNNSLPRLEAEIKSKRAALKAAKAKFDFALTSAAALLGVDASDLAVESKAGEGSLPYWRTVRKVIVKARAGGIIENLPVATGTWMEAKDLILTTENPKEVRFRAEGLQSDLGILKDGLKVFIVPPQGGSYDIQDSIESSLKISLEADPEERTIELLAVPSRLTNWTRKGVSAYLEVIIDETEEPELAIPRSCVVKDGLKMVYFRRDPKYPNEVIRMDADLGVNDGRWVVIQSGVKEGDDVVLEGAYELMLASSGLKKKPQST